MSPQVEFSGQSIETDQSPSSYIYLRYDRILLVGNTLQNDYHSHHALQISLSLDGDHFVVNHPEGHDKTRFAVIAPSYLHQIDQADSWRALILLEAESEAAKAIVNRYLRNDNLLLSDGEIADYCKDQLAKFSQRQLTMAEANQAVDNIIRFLVGDVFDAQSDYDQRIEKVMAAIDRQGANRVSTPELADSVDLSESRLSHLFKKETGVPLRRYLLWQKIYFAGFRIAAGISMTKAAEEAGFADTAHFSRTFRSMFGMSPSDIMKPSETVRVIADKALLMG